MRNLCSQEIVLFGHLEPGRPLCKLCVRSENLKKWEKGLSVAIIMAEADRVDTLKRRTIRGTILE